jgi:histone H3/H4
MTAEASSIEWTDEANERLGRVPVFLRGMVRKRAETLATENGDVRVTGVHMAELAKNRPLAPAAEAASPPEQEDVAATMTLAWTAEARRRLSETPPFFQGEWIRAAEEAARAGGHLEINLSLLDRLEEQEEFRRRLSWTAEAEQALEEALAEKQEFVRVFVAPAMEEAIERIARSAKRRQVERADVEKAFETDGAGVDWSPEALERVKHAPEFVRGGIKKAAEAGARRENIARIQPEHLTRFRNRAMMRAVKRMRVFGFRELTFDVFETARERVPRLKDNPQAEKRFAAIRNHVEGKGGLGVIDSGLLEKMRELLSEEPEREK